MNATRPTLRAGRVRRALLLALAAGACGSPSAADAAAQRAAALDAQAAAHAAAARQEAIQAEAALAAATRAAIAAPEGVTLVDAATAQFDPGASGGPLLREQAAFDVRHYRIEVAIDPASRHLQGHVELTAEMLAPSPLVALHLDQRLLVSAVSVQGRPVEFVHERGLVLATPAAPLQAGEMLHVAVDYAGTPREAPHAPWDGGFTWASSADGSPWFTTTCQGEGADLWWPCKDHPSDKPDTLDLFVTVPEPLFCASNGTLQSVTSRGDGTHTFHWHVAEPISNYNVALNVGPYVQLEATYLSVTGESVPVFFWVLPERRAEGVAFLPQVLDHLRFFEETLGPYPFRAEKYGVVQTPHLGMEHQTIIAYGNEFRAADPPLDDPPYDWLHHHELSHEWWGNLVTCRDWKDMWIHEGFGSYMQALYLERTYGSQAYQDAMQGYLHGLGHRRPVAPRASRDSQQIYFTDTGAPDNDIYSKGAWVLHTLRYVLGDEEFFSFLRRMAYPDERWERRTDGSQVRFVDTEDVRALAEQVAGEDLEWFFEVYLRQPELPRLEVRREADELHLAWQVPEGLRFPMPLPLELDGRLTRVLMPGGRAVVPVGAARVRIDPQARVLMRVDGSPDTAPR